MEQELLRLIHGLMHQVKWQEGKLQEMHLLMKRLEQDIGQLKEQRINKIDKVEYNFDQLKVEKLEGTLNIGLTPADQGEIGQMAVEGKAPYTGSVQTGSDPSDQLDLAPLFMDLDHYLHRELPELIVQMENRYQINLEPEYRKMMQDDIKRQMDARVQTYVGQYKKNNYPVNKEEMKTWVMGKIRNDVEEGVRIHCENMAQQRRSST